MQSETSHGKHKKKKKLLNDENDDFNSSHHQFDDSDLVSLYLIFLLKFNIHNVNVTIHL